MSRTSDRSSAFRLIAQSSSEFAQIVLRPDHPLLLSPPDAIVALSPGLAAIFIPTAAEAADPRRLERRIAQSRLALPIPIATVVVPLPHDRVLRSRAEAFADAVGDPHEIRWAIEVGLSNGISMPVDEQVLAREAALRRMSAIVRRAERRQVIEEPNAASGESLRFDPQDDEATVEEQVPAAPSNLRTQRFQLGSDAAPSAPRSPVPGVRFLRPILRQSILDSVETDFHIEAGFALVRLADQPLPTHDLEASAFDLPPEESASYKVVTAAAFGGWELLGPRVERRGQ